MTDTMIERVARVIAHCRGIDSDSEWLAVSVFFRAECRWQARAAIAAMREPTPAICAAIRDWSEAEHDRTWREAIDAALKEGQE